MFCLEDDNILIQLRCTAHWSKLDKDKSGVRRMRTHTASLIEYFDQKELWDDFGVISDTVMSELLF